MSTCIESATTSSFHGAVWCLSGGVSVYNVPNLVHPESQPRSDFQSLSDYTVWLYRWSIWSIFDLISEWIGINMIIDNGTDIVYRVWKVLWSRISYLRVGMMRGLVVASWLYVCWLHVWFKPACFQETSCLCASLLQSSAQLIERLPVEWEHVKHNVHNRGWARVQSCDDCESALLCDPVCEGGRLWGRHVFWAE